jgi:hypothetical protein
MQLVTIKIEKKIFRYVLMICVFATLVAIGIYAYLGTFSRYLADDYCENVSVNKTSPINAVLNRYSGGATRSSNRYSNLLFVGFSEMLGNHNMQVTVVSMVLLWVVGLCWSVYEIRRFLKIDWSLSFDLYGGMTLGFLSFLQAPNLFQTVYWRSSMMTHFAPLVFGSFLAAFLVRQLRYLQIELPSRLVYVIALFATFIMVGFSEPPATTLVTILPLLMVVIWFLGNTLVKQKQLTLLAWTFAGALLGLMALVFSPAGVNVARETSLGLVAILSRSFIYSYLFIIDSLKIAPLPVLLSILLPFMLIWLYKQLEPSPPSWKETYIILLVIFAIPVLLWLLVAAGFAPSVYGQSFPVERMRFLARTLMIIACMLEGALFGFLLKDLKLGPSQIAGQWVVLVLFAVVAISYPLRAAFNVLKVNVPEYRAHAETWDTRDKYIRQLVAAGAKDIVVTQLDSMHGVVEYKGNKSFWVNVCAAEYYGLHTLVAP